MPRDVNGEQKKTNSVDIALNFASIVNFVALILLRAVIRNRNFLKRIQC